MPRGNTKERIFEESVLLFSEKGYAATTIRQIAAAVNVNEATIYIYFKSKADILDEVLTSFGNKLGVILPDKRRMDSCIKTDSPRKSLSRLFWNTTMESDLFMRQAFRIVCMEQFINEKARSLVTDRLQVGLAGDIQYAMDRLIEQEKIPPFEASSFSVLWTASMYSSAVMAVHSPSADVWDRIQRGNAMLLDEAVSGKLTYGNKWPMHNQR